MIIILSYIYIDVEFNSLLLFNAYPLNLIKVYWLYCQFDRQELNPIGSTKVCNKPIIKLVFNIAINDFLKILFSKLFWETLKKCVFKNVDYFLHKNSPISRKKKKTIIRITLTNKWSQWSVSLFILKCKMWFYPLTELWTIVPLYWLILRGASKMITLIDPSPTKIKVRRSQSCLIFEKMSSLIGLQKKLHYGHYQNRRSCKFFPFV
jgi:hypothetical protein